MTTGVVLLMASDAEALAALAEVALEDGFLPEGDEVTRDVAAAGRRTRAALTKRLAVFGMQVDRLVEGKPVTVQLRDAE